MEVLISEALLCLIHCAAIAPQLLLFTDQIGALSTFLSGPNGSMDYGKGEETRTLCEDQMQIHYVMHEKILRRLDMTTHLNIIGFLVRNLQHTCCNQAVLSCSK